MIETNNVVPSNPKKDILRKIIQSKERDIEELKNSNVHYAFLSKMINRGKPFVAQLQRAQNRGKIAIIAEIKPASPSGGDLWQKDIGIEQYVKSLEKGGATCLSILGEEHFFKGGVALIEQARKYTQLPILWKDFFLDPVQINEAAISGCDAVLIILRIVDNVMAESLLKKAWYMGLDVLLECYSLEDVIRLKSLKKYLRPKHVAIAINNRNLETLQCSLDIAKNMASHVPLRYTRVVASGIQSAQDIRDCINVDFYAFLVGEHLMRSKNPAKTLSELIEQGAHAY